VQVSHNFTQVIAKSSIWTIRESREGKAVIAQLMRVHVVTPQSSRALHSHPRIQPAPYTPIFSPPAILTKFAFPKFILGPASSLCYVGEYVHEPPNAESAESGDLPHANPAERCDYNEVYDTSGNKDVEKEIYNQDQDIIEKHRVLFFSYI